MPKKGVYLITGAAGFIGSCLLRKLVGNNAKAHVIVRKETSLWRIKDLLTKSTCHTSDLSDAEEIKKIVDKVKPTVIYHLATHGAYSYQNDPNRIIQTNILGTWNLLRATSHIDYDLFINTGSSSEYGFKRLPMKETDLLEPASYYAVTKCSQTLLCFHIAREEKRPIVTIRPFSVYGPYEEPKRFVPTLMRALRFKEKMSLVSPQISRDMIYIDDVVDAYLLVDRLKRFPGEIFNIGTGIQSSIKATVTTAVKVVGEDTDFKWGHMRPRDWDTTRWVADISKAKRLLKWSPKVGLKKGLVLTWEWFRSNHGLYNHTRKTA
jgi:nucleoside-diphosphate-sugar epimerase